MTLYQHSLIIFKEALVMSDSVKMNEMEKLLEEVQKNEWSRGMITKFFIQVLHEGKDENLELLLLQYLGANPTVDKNYPLRAASASGHQKTYYALMQLGAEASAEHHRALVNALECERTEIAKDLLHEIEMEALNASSEGKEIIRKDLVPALNLAVIRDYTEIVERILKLGVRPGSNLLASAVRSKNEKVVDLLFVYGIGESKHYNDALEDAMKIAIDQNDEAMVRRLDMMGADADDDTYIIMAAKKGLTDLVNFFARLGANPRANNDQPIETALLEGHLDTVQALQELGADPTVDYMYTLRATARKGYADIVEFLIELKPNNLKAAAERALLVLKGCNVEAKILHMLQNAANEEDY